MLSSSLNRSMWQNNTKDSAMQLESLELDGSGHGFTKVVCMMTDLLSKRYEHVRKYVLNILGGFFDCLD